MILTYNGNPDGAEETVAAIEKRGGTAVALQLDVGASETFDAFASASPPRSRERWQRASFDYLVNNAGFGESRCSPTPPRSSTTASTASCSRARSS